MSNSGPNFANVAFGVSSNWLVFINLSETCENVGEGSGEKEERVRGGGGGGWWWRVVCVVVLCCGAVW